MHHILVRSAETTLNKENTVIYLDSLILADITSYIDSKILVYMFQTSSGWRGATFYIYIKVIHFMGKIFSYYFCD